MQFRKWANRIVKDYTIQGWTMDVVRLKKGGTLTDEFFERQLEKIREIRRPEGDGKGGTYFGATGCGKSYTMLFLSRLLMKSVDFGSPTIVLLTDRTDLDDQLSKLFENAKGYIGDSTVVSVESRAH